MNKESTITSIGAFSLTAVLLSLVLHKAPFPMLLIDRYFPGTGWIEILILSIYAAWIAGTMQRQQQTSNIRLTIWTTFSGVFFAQLILGIAGFEDFLMTGKLHLPIPAMIIAGPLYRGYGWFMPILFTATVLILGSAWCSYLCYFGVWDNLASRNKKSKTLTLKHKLLLRIAILLLVVITALTLRFMGINSLIATTCGATFGIFGLIIIIFISHKKGIMVHCTLYCPMGLIADILGKTSLFRIKIDARCTSCRNCSSHCKYGALEQNDLKRHKPGITCSLCGDCIAACKPQYISYRVPFVSAKYSRMLFITIVVSLHAVFLGLARM